MYMFSGHNAFNTFLIETMYPFSNVGIVMIGCHPYFWNRIIFIFEQNNLGTVIRFLIRPINQIMQNVSFITSNRPEESIPHNSHNPEWLSKGVVVWGSKQVVLVYKMI